jgi:hypothetical protein
MAVEVSGRDAALGQAGGAVTAVTAVIAEDTEGLAVARISATTAMGSAGPRGLATTAMAVVLSPAVQGTLSPGNLAVRRVRILLKGSASMGSLLQRLGNSTVVPTSVTTTVVEVTSNIVLVLMGTTITIIGMVSMEAVLIIIRTVVMEVVLVIQGI